MQSEYKIDYSIEEDYKDYVKLTLMKDVRLASFEREFLHEFLLKKWEQIGETVRVKGVRKCKLYCGNTTFILDWFDVFDLNEIIKLVEDYNIKNIQNEREDSKQFTLNLERK